MNAVAFSLVLAGVLLNAAAQLLLKAGTNRIGEFAFSLDNVVAAVGLTTNVPLVVAGVLVGIVTMFFASAIVARVVRRYPQLVDVAFLIVGFIGVAMATEQALGVEIRPTAKFLVILGMIAVTVAYDEGKRRRSNK